MSAEEALLDLLKDFKPRRCEGCPNDPPLVEAVLGDVELHGFHMPAAVYEHGNADDNRPHWPGCASGPRPRVIYESEYFKKCRAMCAKDGEGIVGIQETETSWKCFCEKPPPDA